MSYFLGRKTPMSLAFALTLIAHVGAIAPPALASHILRPALTCQRAPPPVARSCLPTLLRPAVTYQRAPPPVARDFTSAERLREEVEAPFAKVRLFAWPVLFAAAGIATYFSATGMLAVAVGAREASDSALTDLAIDLGGMAVTGYLWKRELTVRDARLRRIAFGARLAALRVCQLVSATSEDGTPLPPQIGPYASLSDLRRGRGQSRRVVIVCAPAETLRASLDEASAQAASLLSNDFLIVPLVTTYAKTGVLPQLESPPLDVIQRAAAAAGGATGAAGSAPPASMAGTVKTQPPLPWDDDGPNAPGSVPVALAQAPGMWVEALGDELLAAAAQDVGAPARGLTIILKKNGRVGTRRLGTPNWAGLVADVEQRKEAGFDVANI